MSSYIMTSSNNCVTDNSCLSYQYKNSTICVNCSTGCLTCLNSTVCTSCGMSAIGLQYYLKLSTCVLDCSSGYFKYSLGNQCRKCPKLMSNLCQYYRMLNLYRWLFPPITPYSTSLRHSNRNMCQRMSIRLL
jgi:hypothetical protein